MRTKKLENFVSKHLKLSVKVAESLNTNKFVQQSLYKERREGSENLVKERTHGIDVETAKPYDQD